MDRPPPVDDSSTRRQIRVLGAARPTPPAPAAPGTASPRRLMPLRCRAPANDHANRSSSPIASCVDSATRIAPGRAAPVTRLARLTGLPNQSPARLTARPVATPDPKGGSRRSASVASTSSSKAVEHRHRLAADEHHLVADALDVPHRRRRDVTGQIGQPMRELLQILWRHGLAEPGETDEVGERDGDHACAGKGMPSARSVAVTASVSIMCSSCSRSMSVDHGPEQRRDVPSISASDAAWRCRVRWPRAPSPPPARRSA